MKKLFALQLKDTDPQPYLPYLLTFKNIPFPIKIDFRLTLGSDNILLKYFLSSALESSLHKAAPFLISIIYHKHLLGQKQQH